jgi:hypothetical protein
LKTRLPFLQIQGDARLEMKSYHKAERVHFACQNPAIDAVKTWRADLSVDDRLALAADLGTATFTKFASAAAAKLLVQARIIQMTPHGR